MLTTAAAFRATCMCAAQKNVADFGCFVDIGCGKDGLVHISQLSVSPHPPVAAHVVCRSTAARGRHMEVSVQSSNAFITRLTKANTFATGRAHGLQDR